MDYECFLISNERYGLEEGLAPFLLPQDAWSTMNNAYLRRGVLSKRNGYTEFDRMIHAVADESISYQWNNCPIKWNAADFKWGRTQFSGTLSNIPARIGDVSFTDGTQVISDNYSESAYDTDDFTEVDVAANRVVLSGDTVTITGLDNDEDVYVYKDLGAGYCDGNFEFRLKFNCSSSDNNSSFVIWALANSVGDIEDIYSANGDILYLAYFDFAGFNIFLHEINNGASIADSYAISKSTDYYIKVVRDESVGTYGTIYAYIYSDSGFSTLLDKMSVTLTEKQDFRYLYWMSGYNNGVGGLSASYTVSDLTEIISGTDGELSGNGVGNINQTTGVYSIKFNERPSSNAVVNYDYHPGYSIVGIETYDNLSTAESELFVWDKKRCAKWDADNQKLEDITGSDTWNGNDYNYIWGANARNKIYVTNNVDRVKYWDGTGPWTNLLMDIDGDDANDVDTCLVIILYKERLVVFRTTENGTLYPQRARWCKAEDYGDWTNDGYADAPTNDWFICCDFIGEDLICWFEYSCWRLKYTGNADLPFRWEQISVSLGSFAPYSGFTYNDVFASIGDTSIRETDNLTVYDIDSKIPDAVVGMNLEGFDKIYTIQIQELQQAILSYPAVGETANSNSLLYNWFDKSWSRYDYGFNVYGFYKEDTEPSWGDIEETWDELEISWYDKTRQAGYPITLGGDTSGYIYKINYGSSDNGSAIAFEVLSGRWNPYLKKGMRARFGWVEFLVERDADITMTVEFYAHDDGNEYIVATETVTFEQTGDNAEKIWVRADNGAIADFHRMKLTNNASGQTPKIHAIKLYFKPSGKMK